MTSLSVSVQLVYQCSKGISKMYYIYIYFFTQMSFMSSAKEATTLWFIIQ